MTSTINNVFTVSTAAFHVAQYQLCGVFSALLDFQFVLSCNTAVSSAWLRNDRQVILTEMKSPFWSAGMTLAYDNLSLKLYHFKF